MKQVADLLHVTERTVAFHKYTIHRTPWRQDERRASGICLEHGMLKTIPLSLHVLPVSFDSIGGFQRRLSNSAVIEASCIPDAGSDRPRVLLADDHPAMLELTSDALTGECLMVGRVVDGIELDGIEATHQLRRSERPARFVFLTVHEDADYARAALDADGLGYVVKARLASALLPAIRAVLADCSFISPTVAPRRSETNFLRSAGETNTLSPTKQKKERSKQ
jgi:CheY-like chemotaxis protein